MALRACAPDVAGLTYFLRARFRLPLLSIRTRPLIRPDVGLDVNDEVILTRVEGACQTLLAVGKTDTAQSTAGLSAALAYAAIQADHAILIAA